MDAQDLPHKALAVLDSSFSIVPVSCGGAVESPNNPAAADESVDAPPVYEPTIPELHAVVQTKLVKSSSQNSIIACVPGHERISGHARLSCCKESMKNSLAIGGRVCAGAIAFAGSSCVPENDDSMGAELGPTSSDCIVAALV